MNAWHVLVGLAVTSLFATGCGSNGDEAADVTTTALSTSSTVVSSPSGTTGLSETTSTSTASKPLPNGVYVGAFSGVQTDLKLANYSVDCPTSARGVYRVNLAQASFEIESNPANPAAGRVDAATFEQWVDRAPSEKWVVTQSDATLNVRSESAPSDHSVC
jgi:hypothetical protein